MNRQLAPVLMFAALAGCSYQAQETEKAITPVRVASVKLHQPKAGERYSASIAPGRQVTLSFRVSGFVHQLHQTQAGGYRRALEPGDLVSQGTVLARLRQEDYTLPIQQAKSQLDAARENEEAAQAQLAQAQAGLSKAQFDFTRAQSLFRSQSLTRPDFDAAKAQFDSYDAQVRAARAQIESASAQARIAEATLASANLSQRDTALVAPFTAAVVQRNVEVGMLVAPGTQAYTLADVSWVKATFGVPDSVAVHIKPGTSVALSVEALPGQIFKGNVTAVAAVADSESRLFQTEVALSNNDGSLRPGMIATLFLGQAAPAPPVPVVPLSAVVRDRKGGSGFAVMVVEGSKAHSRSIVLGPTYGDQLAVTSGLKPGEQVISSGATLLAEGETVEVIP
jgi:multidrug efflux system membrane fusion protein